jgi:hypothetical protein
MKVNLLIGRGIRQSDETEDGNYKMTFLEMKKPGNIFKKKNEVK